jgi:hypothetical protein
MHFRMKKMRTETWMRSCATQVYETGMDASGEVAGSGIGPRNH